MEKHDNSNFADPADDNIDVVPCIYCRAEIPKKSKKCARCGSFVGRFSVLKNATTEISIVSLSISIFALALPAIQKYVFPQRAEIVATVLRPNGSHFEFLVSNTGRRPGALIEAGIEFTSGDPANPIRRRIQLDRSAYATLIEPNRTYRFSPDLKIETPPFQPPPGVESAVPSLVKSLPKKCTFSVSYIDFDGEEKVSETPYRCLAG